MQRPQKTSKDDCSQKDKLETEEYARVCSPVFNEVGRQDGIDLIDRVIDNNNLFKACEKVKTNKGAPVDVKLNFTLFARFHFTLLLKKYFSDFSCDDFPRPLHHG